MVSDSVLSEIRQAREALAKRFNYDLRAMIQHARDQQAASGRKVVAFPPKSVRRPIAAPLLAQPMQPNPSPEQTL